MIGRRRSIHFKAGLVGWKSDGPLIDAILRKKDDAIRSKSGARSRGVRGLAALDFGIGNEGVRRHRQIGGSRSLADTARGVVLRAVAGAEEAVVIALMGDR